MKTLGVSLILLGLGNLFGCSGPKQEIFVQRWSKSQHSPTPPSIIRDSSFSLNKQTSKVAGMRVSFSEQKLGKAFVESGHLYQVLNADNQVTHIRVQNGLTDISHYSLDLEKLSQQLYENRTVFYERAQTKYKFLRNRELIEDIRLIFDPSIKTKRPFYYRIKFISQTQDQVTQCNLLLSLEIKECERISLHFQAPAWIFTLQNSENLQEVILPGLKSVLRGQLRSEQIQVSSASPSQISTRDLPFRFPPTDPRFDQIQSYYWAERALQFALERFKLSSQLRIEIKTFTGFPELTNAAFSFKNQIRLGRGDGVTYSHIAQDPSIIIHEIGHVLFSQIAYLPSQGQGGSLNEAFADYFAATLLDSPEMGAKSFLKGPFRRTLNQTLSYSTLANRLYQDSLVISSALWEMEQKLGKEKANSIFIESLIRLGPANQISEYVEVLSALIKELPPSDRHELRDILIKREWPIND